jgi:hypothetical protein
MMRRVHLDRGNDPPAPRALGSPPELEVLADRVRRLAPSHRDPEAFHVEKSEIERALRQLARRG